MTTLLKGRIAAALLFASYGILLGTWTSRIPAIKEGLLLSDGSLSIALLGFAAGAITGMQVIGRLVDRYSGGQLMIPLAFVDAVLLVTPAFAPSLPFLVVALFIFGAIHGTVNISMNTNAVEVERAWGSSIMSSFHAVYSIGGFIGAAIGGLCAHSGLSVPATFAIVAVAVSLLVAVAARWTYTPAAVGAAASASTAAAGGTPTGSAAGGGAGADSNAGPHTSTGAGASAGVGAAGSGEGRKGDRLPGVFFLGVLAFCCLVGEGAAADWSTVYVRDTLGSGAGFAAIAYAAFSIMMTVGRLAGDRLAAALGAVTLVRACGVLAGASLGIALLVDSPVAGVVGFGLFGAGLSCIAPLVFSAAGGRNPDRAGQAIARVASLGWIGFLVGPIVIGAVAEFTGLNWALLIPVALALFVALTAPALRTRSESWMGTNRRR